ncbi:hypothetical protein [Streptomyces sp. NPDC056796]|uniref:hypothetical protein n=1 Tax=Streptomyces sp. NPDC056796 TaxID=3345947 RepID=UPI00367F04F6
MRWLRQYGPGSLREDIERTWLEYGALGPPGHDRFGLTVTDRGQPVRLRDPHAVVEPVRT